MNEEEKYTNLGWMTSRLFLLSVKLQKNFYCILDSCLSVGGNKTNWYNLNLDL